jgi:hypothetical protein
MGELRTVTLNVQTVNGPETVTGVLLGESSSHRGHHNHGEDFSPPGVRCSACRWMQVQILYDEAAEGYVVLVHGRSIVPDESDRCRLERTVSPIWVIETLRQPQRKPGARPGISQTALKAITEAARYDADIADAYAARRAEVVG